MSRSIPGSGDDDPKLRSADRDEIGGRWLEQPVRCRKIGDPRLRRLILARLDALLAARGPKAG